MRRRAAALLDNLWLWAVVALLVMFIYGVWALAEIISMHAVPHKPA